MLDDMFWDGVPPLDVGEYLAGITEDSSVAKHPGGRDCEMQMLFKMCLMATGLSADEASREAQISRVNTRRNFFGEWTDDGDPFSESEVRKARTTVKPWR